MKKFLLLLLAVLTCLCCAFVFASCNKGGENIDGTYYLYENKKHDEDSWIKIDGKSWSDDDDASGRLKKSGSDVIFYIDMFGEDMELAEGTVKNGVLTLSMMGESIIYCKEGVFPPHKHDYQTLNSDETGHWKECTECGSPSETEEHTYNEDDECTVCGYLLPTEGLSYELSEGKDYYIVSGSGSATGKNIRIPSTKVYKYWSSGCGGSKQKEKELPVTAIEGFYYSSEEMVARWDKIIIPESVTSIRAGALSGCKTIILEGNNPNYAVQDGILYNKAKTEIVTIPIGLSGNITLSDGITTIASSAFANRAYITGITIPDGVTSIGNKAFSNCTGLTSITVSENNTTYASQDGILYNKAKTEFIHIPTKLSGDVTILGGVTSIGAHEFSGCRGLASVTIGNGVTSIGDCAFAICSGLTSVTIPDSVTSIGNFAFEGCYKLVEIVNKSSLTITAGKGYVAYYAKQVISDEAESKIIEQDDYLFYNDNETYSLLGYIGSAKEIALPANINGHSYAIYQYAFYDRSDLTKVTIPDGVTSIGDCAFLDCNGLTSVSIGNGVTSIGDCAFLDCNGLTSVSIGNGVTSISESAFSGCSGIIQTENGVSYVDKWVVDCDTSVTSVSLRTDTKRIADCAFEECSGLTSITIPDGVTSIGEYAFSGCRGLTSVTIGNGVTSIGERAFARCSGLTSVTIPDSVTSIGEYAFYECSGLTSVSIGNGVTSIGERAFEDCSGLTSVTIPDSVTSIGEGAFDGCSNLKYTEYNAGKYLGNANNPYVVLMDTTSERSITSFTIPTGTKIIYQFAFYNCYDLTSVTIPDSVTSIGNYAFYNCDALTAVYYTGTAEDWAGISIGYGDSRLTSAQRYYYSETESAGCWHYVNGAPTLW